MITRPVLRYHGGKWRIADWVTAHLPRHHCYVEPFGGAASVLMVKPRSVVEVYNDLDGRVVNLFRILRDPDRSEQLRRALVLTPYSRAEFAAAWSPADDPVEDARRLVVRTAMAIGAKPVHSRNGWRAGPTHRSPALTWRGYPEQFPAYLERLREVLLEQQPATAVIARYDSPATLFYVDPPYVLGTRAWGHRKVYAHELEDADHAALLQQLRGVRGMVALSGYRSAIYDDVLHDWLRLDIKARAQANRPRVESLWLSPAAVAAMPQSPLTLEDS